MDREIEAVGRVYQPMSRALEIAVRGIRVRLGRSIVTLSSVVLAVTFLSFTGTSNVINRALVLAWQGSGDQALKFMLEKFGVNVKAALEGDPRDYWLIGLSLLTCGVGIANAMLMSVTERFREIGTMKCLGALDGFVMKLFLFESAFLGLVGTTIGLLLGLGIGTGTKLLQFGGYVWQYLPGLGLAKVLGLSVLVGLILSTLGACYPAYLAAKMEPVEALRVEE